MGPGGAGAGYQVETGRPAGAAGAGLVILVVVAGRDFNPQEAPGAIVVVGMLRVGLPLCPLPLGLLKGQVAHVGLLRLLDVFALPHHFERPLDLFPPSTEASLMNCIKGNVPCLRL